MENENLINEQQAPVVEKVSAEAMTNEQAETQPATSSAFSDLIDSMLALNDKEIKKAIAYVEKQMEKLKKGK